MNIQKVLHDHSLTSTEKVVYVEVYTQNKMNWHCNMTNAELARLLGVSQKTISRSLTKLHKFKYLNIFNQGNMRIAKVNEN
ncbi:MAG: helix-turn-helix domain-containing protein [Staphylococcus equorum]|nr:helix-turn-helix domain-containing protein [Staphylococcus equorum]MDN6612498.1 helix-turn-helix domain-containing protein [Staphylococcus equorum]